MTQVQKLAIATANNAQPAGGCSRWQSFAPTFADNLRNLQTSFRRLFVVDQTDTPLRLDIEDLLRQSAESQASLRFQLETVCPVR
jgi:hypothetical protein